MYQVLARKYRPQTFAELLGQEHVRATIENAIAQRRIAHGYIFAGQRGTGKTTVARILARCLNCVEGPAPQPCGRCSSCVEIAQGNAPDVIEIDAASNRGINEMRELRENVRYRPSRDRYKIFIIDEAHQITNEAFNALLKTLEEPPEYLKFVLATTDPEKMLPTVLSRCLQFNLRPMAPDTVHEHLARVLQAEQVVADDGALRLLARAARGSMRDALSLTDQAIAFGGGQLQETVVRQMLGAVDRSHVLRLIDALARGDGAAVVDTVDALRVNGLNAASTLEEININAACGLRTGLHHLSSHTMGADPIHAGLARAAENRLCVLTNFLPPPLSARITPSRRSTRMRRPSPSCNSFSAPASGPGSSETTTTPAKPPAESSMRRATCTLTWPEARPTSGALI